MTILQLGLWFADYIKEVDFRKEIEDAKISIIEKKDLIECYNRSKENLEERIDYKVLDQYNLQVQQYIRIKDGVPYLESFIVGEGIFFSVYDSDYAFEHLRIDKQDLIVPTYDYDTGCLDINYGHDIGKRDYRKYETLENIRYLISCKNVEEVGVDLLCCEAPGISFYISQAEVIKLFNPNMYRNIILIDGCIEFDYSKVVTQVIH